MAVITWLIVLFLGIQCSVGEINTGCKLWKIKGDDVCCDTCHPGNKEKKIQNLIKVCQYLLHLFVFVQLCSFFVYLFVFNGALFDET